MDKKWWISPILIIIGTLLFYINPLSIRGSHPLTLIYFLLLCLIISFGIFNFSNAELKKKIIGAILLTPAILIILLLSSFLLFPHGG